MRIKSLWVHGFGKLRDLRLELSPGINLIVGENESGKSTLQQALVASVFGFYDYQAGGGKHKAHERDAERRYRPWDPLAPYHCTVEYTLDDGTSYHLERTFSANSTTFSLRNIGTGEEVTAELELDAYGAMQPIHQQQYLGMTKEVFLSSACVDQGKLRQLSAPVSLTEAVVKALDSDEADVSAKAAVASLEKAFRSSVGTSRASTTLLASRRRELAEAEARLLEWDSALGRVDSCIREEATQIEKLERLKRRRARQAACLTAERLDEVDQLIQRVARLDAELVECERQKEQLREYEAFPADLRDQLLELRSELGRTEKQVEGLIARQAQESPRVDACRRQLAEAEATAKDLQHLRSFPAEQEDHVRTLKSRWLAEAQRLREAEAKRIQAMEVAPSGIGQMSLATLAVGSMLAVVLILAGAFLEQVPLFAVLGLAVLAISVVVARRPVELDAKVPSRVGQELASASQAERAGREALMSLLSSMGVQGGSPEVALDQYEGRLRDWHRLQEAEERAAASHRELSDLHAHDLELEEAKASWRASTARFRELVSQAGITTEDVGEAWQEYEVGLRRHSQFRELEERSRSMLRERALVLSGRTVENLEEERSSLARRLAELAQESPPLDGDDLDPLVRVGQDDLSETEHEIQQTRIRLAELRREIDLGLPDGPSRAELEEQVSELRLEVERLERFGEALQIASGAIEDAAKKAREDFVPQLNERMGQTLGIITTGRYAHISLQLSGKEVGIKVRDPETGREADVDQLSLGTIEQCYICLRLAIADILSDNGERLPLLLDDPFVNFDRSRLERMLEFLVRVGQERQVLFFTKDRSLIDWFQGHIEAPEALRVFPMTDDGGAPKLT